jgi:hypothetical protein
LRLYGTTTDVDCRHYPPAKRNAFSFNPDYGTNLS